MGNSHVTGLETITFTDNMSFDGTQRGGAMTTDGQLWIGSSTGRHVRLGNLIGGSGITVNNGSGSITISADGSIVGQTITGNTGGAISPIAGNWDLFTSNSTVKFTGTPGTETLDFGLSNLLLGSSGSSIGVSAGFNTGVGLNALLALTSGIENTSIGNNSSLSLTTGSNNSIIGGESFTEATSASFNSVLGVLALNSLSTGNYNIAIGYTSGGFYSTTETSNIVIGNQGLGGESNVIRIGTQGTGNGQQIHCYLAGVLHTTSGRTVNITTPGAYPYTTLISDYVILVDTSSARTITPLASPVTGTMYVIKDNVGSAAANNITVTPSGKNIDGVASYVMNQNYESITIVYNGTQWNII